MRQSLRGSQRRQGTVLRGGDRGRFWETGDDSGGRQGTILNVIKINGGISQLSRMVIKFKRLCIKNTFIALVIILACDVRCIHNRFYCFC